MPAAPEQIAADEFASAMARLGYFEPAPHLGVAVSGGPDSVALGRLAARWAAGRAGRVTFFTVDHGLRAAGAAEAGWVRDVAAGLGAAHATLDWARAGSLPTSQAAARAGRYQLLDRACAEHGCLHLLVGHHAADQARTTEMRRRRGLGPGLAGMPAVRELDHCRLLRPLLDFPPERLRATAALGGRGWIDDPSNRDPRFERTTTCVDAAVPVDGRWRRELDVGDAGWLARNAWVEGGRGLGLDGPAWLGLSRTAAGRLLGAAAAAVGWPAYRPSQRRSDLAARRLLAGARGITLAGAAAAWRGTDLMLRPERVGCSHWPLADAPFAALDVVSPGPLHIC